MESVDLVDTHPLQTGVDGLFDRSPFQLATVVRGQCENLSVDREALGRSFGLPEQFLRAPWRRGRISAGGIEVGDIVLFETVQNFLYVFKTNEAHAKRGSTEDKLRGAHFADGRWWLRIDRTGEGGAINTTMDGCELKPDEKFPVHFIVVFDPGRKFGFLLA